MEGGWVVVQQCDTSSPLHVKLCLTSSSPSSPSSLRVRRTRGQIKPIKAQVTCRVDETYIFALTSITRSPCGWEVGGRWMKEGCTSRRRGGRRDGSDEMPSLTRARSTMVRSCGHGAPAEL